MSRESGEEISPGGITPTRAPGNGRTVLCISPKQFVATRALVGSRGAWQEAVAVRAIAASGAILGNPAGPIRRQIRDLAMNAAAYDHGRHGCAAATHASGVPALIVRGISDHPDGKRLPADQKAGASER